MSFLPQSSRNKPKSFLNIRTTSTLALFALILFSCLAWFPERWSEAANLSRERRQDNQRGASHLQSNEAEQLSSSGGLWRDVAESELPAQTTAGARPKSYRALELSQTALAQLLAEAPMEFTAEAGTKNVLVSLPLPDGRFRRFRIQESPILSAELAAQYPEIKTYRGQGIDDPTATMRMSWTPTGLQAFVISEQGSFMVAPFDKSDLRYYLSFFTHDVESKAFECLAPNQEAGAAEEAFQPQSLNLTGGTLRNYRLAISVTVDFITYIGGGTVAGAVDAASVYANTVRAYYEREIAISFTIVAIANPAYYGINLGNGNLSTMNQVNQAFFDSGYFGSNRYDIGHVMGYTPQTPSGLASFGPGGNNGVGGSCAASYKAQSSTLLTGPAFNDYWGTVVIAHEFGHMFGARHTFKHILTTQCAQAEDPLGLVEPGSGSTIMSYAGGCAADNLFTNNPNSAANTYFHINSLLKIANHRSIYSTCGAATGTGNSEPVMSDEGSGATIPRLTPFTLTAAASDPNGDPITYCWEQYDTGAPVFRSYPPVSNPSRTFPSLTYILNNDNLPPLTVNGFFSGEGFVNPAPNTTYPLNFTVTVRDNRSSGGGTVARSALLQVLVSGNAGPFKVTQPNTAVVWTGASQRTITWDVANTNLSPVNTTNVRILLSTDGGNTFPFTLANSTSNDGSEVVTMPNIQSSAARIKIEAVGNIYFDISNANFTINSVVSTGSLQFSASAYNAGENDSSATITVTRLNGNTGAVSVNYATTAGGTATPGSDYTTTSGTLNFANGETSKSFTVPILNDLPPVFEGNETVNLTLSNPTGGATLGIPSTAVLTIVDGETQPIMRVSDRSLNEGNAGATTFNFNVSLNYASTQSISVAYATAPGTATSGSDYLAASGTLNFAPGEMSKNISVNVNGDATLEADENLFLNLSNPVNATVSDGQGIGAILNDDSNIAVIGGALDTSFGTGGKVTTTTGNSAGASSVVMQPDGKILAAGYGYNGAGYDFAIARFNPNGTLDAAFGTGGKVATDFGGSDDFANAILRQPDGKIVVIGQRNFELNGYDIVLARYTATGALDTTFGTGGKVITDFGNGDEYMQAAALQADGKIVVGGGTGDLFFPDFSVVRYNGNGTLDTSFGTGGRVTTPIGGGPGAASEVLLQPDGKIVALGYSGFTGGSFDFAVVRINPNGTFDSSFGTGGQTATDFGNTASLAFGGALQPDGRVIAVGYTSPTNLTEGATALARYNVDGSLDNSFGTGGKVVIDAGDGGDTANAIALQSNGKFVVAGFTGFGGFLSPGLNASFSVIKFNGNGTPDTSFGSGGRVSTDFDNGLDSATSLALQPDGKVLVAGSTSNSASQDFALARYLNADPARPRFDFDGDARTDVSVFRPSNGAWYLQRSSAGFTGIVFGANGDIPAPADYDGDGKTDLAVFRPSNGFWYLLNSANQDFTYMQFGTAGDIALPGYYDGDDRADLCVYRPGENTYYFLYTSDNSFHFLQWGQAGDVPVTGDYDGDRKTDFAVFSPSTGTFYILQTSNGTVREQQFGINQDKPIAGDFDGDGKIDIAVYRPSTSGWYYLQSSDNSFRGIAWGASGDIASAGDYDGDGKWDVAVFRPSTGTFYILQSTNNSLRAEQFGSNGDVPIPSAYVQ